MKIYDGTNAILGRMATRVAKDLLKGEDVHVVNCNEIIITGNKTDIKKKFEERKRRVGSSQKGPKISRSKHLIVKRAIRGMLPNFREGRGRVAWKKLKCYPSLPKEFEDKEKVTFEERKLKKVTKLKDY